MSERRNTEEMLDDLQSAAERLLRGEPIRSNGKLNVSTLMEEAGISRVYAYRDPYNDVTEWFKRQVALGSKASPSKPQAKDAREESSASEIADLKRQLSEAGAVNDKLSSQVAYLSETVRTLEAALAGVSNVTPLKRL